MDLTEGAVYWLRWYLIALVATVTAVLGVRALQWIWGLTQNA